MTKVYLGDSVYIELIDRMLKLTTENGLGASNIVYMEPETFRNLILYVRALDADYSIFAKMLEER